MRTRKDETFKMRVTPEEKECIAELARLLKTRSKAKALLLTARARVDILKANTDTIA